MVEILEKNKFKLPILYSSDVKETNEHLIDELELVKCNSEKLSENKVEPVLTKLFSPKTSSGKELLSEYAKHFTTNKEYIKDTQKLFDIYKPTLKEEVINNFNNSILSIKDNINFLKDYQYLDIKQLHFLNKNEMFLQLFSIYNITSPVVALIYPIIIFIIPFLLLKLRFKDLEFNNYKTLLQKQLMNTLFGKLRFIIDGEVDTFKKLYILLTLGLYLYGIYNNIKSCINFIENIKKIKKIFLNCKEYFTYIYDEYIRLQNITKSIKSYEPFINSFTNHIDSMKYIESLMKKINITLKNPLSIGSSLLVLHKLNYDNNLDNCFKFLNNFTGFIDLHIGVCNNIKIHKLGKVQFTSKSTSYRNMYHPCLEDTIIHNNIKMNRNVVLSGQNASGKTTLIKGLCINILLSQQLGYGYFKSCKLNPYDTINCYLNINDTNDKDSLFQAEAKRCKHILDDIKENNKKRHFCIFDELYSGTNPEDAVNAAYKYLTYLSNFNCNFIITTHYKDLCEKLNNSKKMVNNKMVEYKLKEGIIEKSNGLLILDNLDYPKELLNIV